MGDYRMAPTSLYNLDGESKRFNTQEEVDAAWEDGWFGPPWLVQNTPLLSTKTWGTKAEMLAEIAEDARYDGLTLSPRKSVKELMGILRDFEIACDVEAY